MCVPTAPQHHSHSPGLQAGAGPAPRPPPHSGTSPPSARSPLPPPRAVAGDKTAFLPPGSLSDC